ncbi:MAG: DNA-binding protein [Anaerolineaceae bacterium 4572_78]|nr:MAG: DNA-binding protein [Anaerolineaceae bacterium 4572_78]
MKSNVYIETSVVSYLTSRASRNLIIAAYQQVTHEWWDTQKHNFDVFISQLVLQEASSGDEHAVKRRLQILENIPSLALQNDAVVLANELVQKKAIPEKAMEDALHVAVATTNGMDYLLTWNFKHIANAVMRHKIEYICRENGYEPPVLCSPQELL